MKRLDLIPTLGPTLQVLAEASIIGRDPACEVVVPDGSVSRRHARLERRGDTWFVIDQGSANGTSVDGHPVTGEAPLSAGQELRLGFVAFRVEIADVDPGDAADEAAEGDETVVELDDAESNAVARVDDHPAGGAQGSTATTTAMPALAPPPSPTASVPPPSLAASVPPPAAGRLPSAAVQAPSPPPPPAAPRKGPGPLLWIGGGCCGCLLLLMMGLAGIGGLFYSITSGVIDEVRAVVALASQGSVEEAWARTDPQYQARVPLADFERLVAEHPGLAHNADVLAWPPAGSFSVHNNDGRVSAVLVATSGEREQLDVRLSKTSGAWRITDLSFDGGTGALPPDSEGDAPATDAGGASSAGRMTAETLGVNQAEETGALEVSIEIRVSGHATQATGEGHRMHLALDLETFSPDGQLVPGASREDLQQLDTVVSDEDRAAVFRTHLTLTSPPPGRWRARMTVRDLIGGGQVVHEVPLTVGE